jgi:hypothetical protein
MASYREMDAVGRDRARFVLMARQCLLLSGLDDKERQFLKDLISGNEMMGGKPDRLSTRQAEWLFEIREKYELHTHLVGDFSVAILIQRVHEARLDIDDPDLEWITKIWQRVPRPDRLRRSDIGRLRRCAIRIGEIEPYMVDDAA